MKSLKYTAVSAAAVLLLHALPSLPAAAAGTDLYVGYPGKQDNYSTVQAAVNAAAGRKPASENDRVTIHIAPGTYREQVTVNTPYLSFVNDEPSKQVMLTWYYGIGYKYYSVGSNGEHSADAARAKNAKNEPTVRWGCSVRLRGNADYFRAQNITFENSFNRYVTDEELADGVEVSGSQSINFYRTKGADVQSKAATERAAALAIEADYCEFSGCGFMSSQDTLYIGGGTGYFKDCMIEGNTDYIFGQGGTYVFEDCELRFKGYSSNAVGGYITAMKDSKRTLFYNCSVTAGSLKVSAGYFGRPWGASADVAFVNTQLQYEGIITGAGWTSMSGNQPENAKFKEYGTTANGAPVNTSGRVRGTVQYSANGLDPESYLDPWVPAYRNGGTPYEVPAISGTLVRDLKPVSAVYPWEIREHTKQGDLLYTDRTFRFESLPEVLSDGEAVVTPCDGKKLSGTLASFTAAADEIVYVILDDRVEKCPGWLADWELTGLTARNNDNVGYVIYKKAFAAGETVELGENGQSSYCTNYTVIVKEDYGSVTAGDISGDGSVDVRDLTLLRRHLLQQGTLEGKALAAADFDADGSVTVNDAVRLTEWLVCSDGAA